MQQPLELIAKFLFSSNYLQKILISCRNDSFRIVYLHMVGPHNHPYYFNSGISPEEFKRIVEFLNENYTIIPLSKALEMNDKGVSLKNCLSITTDDGFVENYEYVAPILKKLKISATFFLINDCIDNKNLMWRNKIIYIQNRIGLVKAKNLMINFSDKKDISRPLKKDDLLSWSYRNWDMRLKEIWVNELWAESNMEPIEEFLEVYKPYMTTVQVQELVANGFEIGAHSMTHPFFNTLTFQQAESEIFNSINEIGDKIGKKIYQFSYPFGPRAKKEIEHNLKVKYPDKIRTILGIKNSLSNFNDANNWERDLIEKSYYIALMRFLLLPIIRKKIFIPLGIKK